MQIDKVHFTDDSNQEKVLGGSMLFHNNEQLLVKYQIKQCVIFLDLYWWINF